MRRTYLTTLAALLVLAAEGVPGSAEAQDAPRAQVCRFECPPAPGQITIDGVLDPQEWTLGRSIEINAESQIVRKATNYGGPADLSGRILVCRSATTLYVAGEVKDDVVFWNPDEFWKGDGVELFFDLRQDAAPRTTDQYDSDTYQLILHPLASEVRWNFASFRGREGRMDDPLDGIELAGTRFQDERGTAVGYRFEVALPLANFPGAPTAKGESIGFEVALSDSDGLAEQRNYATWSGHAELSRLPSRFGRLVLGDDPPPVATSGVSDTSQTLPLALLVVLGLAAAVWMVRRLAEKDSGVAAALARLSAVGPRAKCVAAGVLVALVVLAGPATTLAARALADRDLADKREVAAIVRDVATEAGSVGLGRPQPPVHPSPLLSLLTGQAVKSPVDFDFTVLPPMSVAEDGTAVPEVTARTLSGVPFLRRDIPATAAWSGSFLVQPPVAAEAATIVYSWKPDPASDAAPKAGEVVAEVRFVHLDGTVDAPVELVWGRHVDATDDRLAVPGGAHPGAPDAVVAFVSGTVPETALPGTEAALATATHGDEVRVPLAARDSPVVRIEVERHATGGRFTTHGITLHRNGGADAVPLPLGRPTRSGIPTAACAFPSPDAGLLLSRTTPRIDVPCDVIADRVWLVVSLRRGFPDARFGLPVLGVRAEFDDGSADGPYPLENGVDVDAEPSPARQHGDRFRSELAFEWGLPDEPRRHADLWSVPLAHSGRRIARLHFEFKGADEVVRVSSIVLGAPGRPPETDRLQRLESTSDGFRLAAALRDRLDLLRAGQGLEFTSFRDGAALATTAKGADRDRSLARTVTEEAAAAIAYAEDGVHEVRLVESRRVHALSVPLAGARPGSFLEMTWSGTAEASFESLVFRIRALLGILLAPLAVLLAADAILRLRSFHARLVAVCAAVSAVPAVLGFFAVRELVSGQIEATEREAVLEKAAIVKARIAALPGAARTRAEAALSDQALVEALKLRGSGDLRPTVAAALKDLERNLGAETVPGARVALDVLPMSGAVQREVFPKDAQYTVFRDRVSQITSTLAYRWSRLTARGAATRFESEGDWQETLVVDLPVDRAALDASAAAAGGDVQVRLYTPRGFPLAETAARVAADELPEECERKLAIVQRVLHEQQPVVETRTLGGTQYTVAYDVLRGESGDVSLVATALPRAGADALLARVRQTSLFIFGAGVAMQFLLLGLVAIATSRPLRRIVERARTVTRATSPGEEISDLATAVSELEEERDAYRTEVALLSTAVAALAQARDPETVVTSALDLVRSAAAPWGAVILTSDADGRHEVSGGFRGDDRVPRMPLVIDEHSPLLPVVRGRGAARVAAVGTVADSLSRDERRLLEGTAAIAAFPLAGDDERGGALVLLLRPVGPVAQRRVHDDFLCALARQVGLALGSARLVRLAVRDSETGAHVASYFAERLREEVDRAVAAKRPIALVVAAVSVPPSDPREARAAAQRLAERLRAIAPPRAFLGRMEPFVFAMAVPENDRAAADALATSLRRAVAEPALADLRVRVGCAACPEDAGSSEFLQAEARRRLAGESAPEAARSSVAPDAGDQLVAEARKLGAVFVSDEGRALLETIQRIASSTLTILVEGETGTGKEVVADLVHRWSPRRDKPLVKINCAALPDALLESELFGYERGAFTGADRSKPGRFELAEGGTLFLDEVGEMPLATQAKLLRVLEDRTVEHLGGTRPIAINVRVIVATNRDLRRMVAEGRFREDLYYRLNAFTIAIPPLRARKEDIPALADAFLRAAAETQGRKPPTLQPDAMDVLFRHDWPGNVRELRNLMEQVVVLRPADALRAADLLPSLVRSQRPRIGDTAREPARSGSSAAAPAASSPASFGPSAGPPAGAPSRDPRDLDSPAAVSDRQKRLLALLGERTWITTSDYCEIVGISPRTALRDVRELVERGVIVMEGKRRGARYRLP